MVNQMEKKVLFIVTILCIAVSFVSAMGQRPGSVPVIANESFIEGIVSEYAILSSHLAGIEPRQVLYRLTVTIESSRGMGGGPDFLKEKKGMDVPFYSKEKISHDMYGKKIKARVAYSGDERGGIYWIHNIE